MRDHNAEASGRMDAFAAILYAEPGALGVLANIIAALVVAVENILAESSTSTSILLAGIHLLLVGGFLQLIAAFLSFRRNDHLTATAFVVFSALWFTQGISHLLMRELPLTVIQQGSLPAIVGFCAVTLVLCVCAITVNYIMPPVLAGILMTLIFEGVGLFHLWGRRVAAAFELFIALAGCYAVLVLTLKGISQRYVLPGMGNAPFNVLLIKSKAKEGSKNEKQKNTKYAEPVALGYLANIVPATVMAFHHLGYFSDFRAASPVLLTSALCHGIASYYSLLRHDFLHAVQFACYLIFWMSKSATDLAISDNLLNVDTRHMYFYGQCVLLVIQAALVVSSLCETKLTFFYNAFVLLQFALSLDQIPAPAYNYTFGVTCVILAVITLYVSFATLVNTIAEKSVIYVGGDMMDQDKLKQFICKIFRRNELGIHRSIEEGTQMDSYVVDCISFIGNSVAAFCLTCGGGLPQFGQKHAMPWILIAGVLIQVYAGRLAYAAGSLVKFYCMLVFALHWAVWAVVLYNPSVAASLCGCAIVVLVLHTAVVMCSVTFQRVWMPFTMFMELNIISLVLRCYDVLPPEMLLTTTIITGIVALYACCAIIINVTVRCHVLPLGNPLMKEGVSEEMVAAQLFHNACPTFPSRRTTSAYAIAALLDNGGVCGVPTDTVYALAASCKHPQSISKIYHIKGRPAEKPICLCLSDVDQLMGCGAPFSDLLWEFMRRCYPGGISCVVPKGPWLRNLGLEDAVEYIGTKGSVCIRVPDSAVLAYLISLTGPVALTSANPSGGADSTHHDMVLQSLGEKLDGVLCDGESNEVVASTVVSCLKIDEGEITFCRVGCTPVEKIEKIFEEAKAAIAEKSVVVTLKHRHQTNKSTKETVQII